MTTIGFIWFYANFLIAAALTRILQILLKNVAPSVSAGLGALI